MSGANRSAVDNPFERYDLDPRDGIAEITRRLKELAEEAKDDAERERIRETWEELTLHPARRLRAALFAHPESHGPHGSPPPLPRRPGAGGAASLPALRELALWPSAALALGSATEEARSDADRVPSLEDDPVLQRLP